jgi:DNA topoisomerase II
MSINIKQFFNEDYITFASYDNQRKLNKITDGLKISQRKVLYTVLKNNIDSEQKEIKVEQLSAKTSEQTQYLHGANSLNGVAVGLATKYVGSNNINLLEPDGNFGTRFINDASAPRYIYTYLSNLAKLIFKKEDEPILEQQTFEGQTIEPKSFYPIIPMVLVNGTNGLSVGFSSNIAPRNPLEIIKVLEYKLKGKNKKVNLLPYFKGFNGTIEKDEEENKYILYGKYIQNNSSKLTIIEIPIKYNLKSYIKVLDNLCERDIIKNYKDLSDNDCFKFEVNVRREFFLDKTEKDILQTLKLVETITDNLTLLDGNGKVKEYSNIEEILNEYYNIRYKAYEKRKQYQLKQIENELLINESKSKFIQYILNKTININDDTKELINKLEQLKFNKINNSYDYLLDMKISSFTKDKVEQLLNKISIIKNIQQKLFNTTIEEMWLQELNQLKQQLKKRR